MLARDRKSWIFRVCLVASSFAWLGGTAIADPPRRFQNRGAIVPRNGFNPGNVGRGFVPNNPFRYRFGYGYGYGYNPYGGVYPSNPWGPYYGVPYYGVPNYGYYPRSIPGAGVGVGGWPKGPSFGGGGIPSGPSYGGGAGSFRGGR